MLFFADDMQFIQQSQNSLQIQFMNLQKQVHSVTLEGQLQKQKLPRLIHFWKDKLQNAVSESERDEEMPTFAAYSLVNLDSTL